MKNLYTPSIGIVHSEASDMKQIKGVGWQKRRIRLNETTM